MLCIVYQIFLVLPQLFSGLEEHLISDLSSHIRPLVDWLSGKHPLASAS